MTSRKPGLLNVRQHLEHLRKVIDLYHEHGDCPLGRAGLVELTLYNEAILRKDAIARATTSNRKDIYINSPQGYGKGLRP